MGDLSEQEREERLFATLAPEIRKPERLKKELSKQSDRGAAILAGVHIDIRLREAIEVRLFDHQLPKQQTLFNRLFEGRGPLESLSAKADLAFATLIIGPHTYADINIIREIRNFFAHELDVGKNNSRISFETQSIAAKCKNLWLPQNEPEVKPSTAARATFLSALWIIDGLLEKSVIHTKVYKKPYAPNAQNAPRFLV